MGKYIRESIQILSLSLMISIFPHFVLAKTGQIAEIIEKKISTMSIEEKVGQLFLIGFPQTKLSPELEDFIGTYKPGAFLLFKRNITSVNQIRELNTILYRTSYKYTKLPPLIAIDQEGGSVSRLPIFPSPPNALAIGQTQSPLLANEMGYQTGLFLREVGFNMNLAPVLDVADPLSGSFIGARSFGADPQLVGDLGLAYSHGLLKARVIPTAKHFPGVGSINSDPHLGVVLNPASLETLKKTDLKPYESYIKLGDKIALMLSHFIYPALDESREPASFSKKISTNLLRNEMNFQGLVITDDLQMQGTKRLLRPEFAALKALQSGADIVMLTWSFDDQGKAFEYVKKSVETGSLSLKEIDDKVRRILTVKAFVNLYRRNPQQSVSFSGWNLTSKEYSDIEANILEQNLKTNLIAKTLQIKNSESKSKRNLASIDKVCVLAPSNKFIFSFQKSSDKTLATKLFNRSFSKQEMENWILSNHCPVSIVAVTGPKTAHLVYDLTSKLKKKLVVVNLSAPILLARQKGFLRVIQLYFNHNDSGKKVAQHLDEILDSSIHSYSINF